MAFGGGGGGQLTPHVHNSVPLQGGPLAFANDTISGMNAGSTTFSNGAALQELVIGNPADTLVVNGAGTAPEWGSGGGGDYVLLGSQRLTVDASQMRVTFAAQTGDTTGSIYACWNTVSDAPSPYAFTEITINNVTTASWYTTQKLEMQTGAGSFSETTEAYIAVPSGASLGGGWIECICPTPQLAAAGYDTIIGYSGTAYGHGPGRRAKMFIGSTESAGVTTETEFTSIEINASTGNWRTGSQLAVYASKI